MSVGQLAEALAIPADELEAIEEGEGDVHLDLVQALAEALKVTPYQLFEQGEFNPVVD